MFDWALRALGHSRLPYAHRVLWRSGVFASRRPMEFAVDWCGIRYHGNLEHYVDRQLYYLGAYEAVELEFLNQAASILRKRRGRVTACDIGANVGQHSLFLHRKVDRIVAFEPSPVAAGRLRTNIERNGISNIEVHEIALSDRNRVARLGSGLPGNDGSRSLNWTLDEDDTIEVKERHAGTYLSNMRPELERVDLIKLDVEGSEKRIVEAMSEWLSLWRPIVVFELVGETSKGGFDSAAQVREALYPDHVLFSLAGRYRPRLAPFNWSRYKDAVCIPAEYGDDFRKLAE